MKRIARHLDIAAELVSRSSLPLDRLPYTDEFEPMCEQFKTLTGTHYSKHEAWLYFLSARKRGLVGPSRRRPRNNGCITA